MADVVVDPDGTGDYISLNAAIIGEAADITGGAGNFVIGCTSSSGSADTTNAVVNGFTTDASHRLIIEAESGDEAIKTGIDASRYRLAISSGTALTISDKHVSVSAIQIVATSTGGGIVLASVFSGNDLRIYNCYIQCAGGDRCVYGNDANIIIIFWNCVFRQTASGSDCVNIGSPASAKFYNCIATGSSLDGIEFDGGTGEIKNCAIFNNTDDIDNAGTVTIDYCASDDGDGTNAVSPFGADWDNEYNDSANGDFTLLNGGNCYHGGTDNPSSGLYTTDMEGDSYNSGSYSIGVDEYLAAGGRPLPQRVFSGPFSGPFEGPF